MRPIPAALLATLCAASHAPAQTIDLTKWTIEHINGTGTWTVDAPRLYTNFTNLVNTDCSVLYSDFPVTTLEFRMSVQSVGDDDVIGFVLGYHPGDATSASSDYLLVDWKKVTQAYQDWGTSTAGLALSRVTGVPTKGFGGGPIDLWSHTGVCKELARATNLGQTGWSFATPYYFKVTFNAALVDISVNGRQEFRLTGPFKPGGRFGVYNYSQSGHETQFPVQAVFQPYGTGCKGSAGTPLLAGVSLPWIGDNFQILISSLPPSAPALFLLGVSKSTWGAIPLPLDLTPLGAPGCWLHASADFMGPVTNLGGAALVTLPLPATLLPAIQLFVQGAALEGSANRLGLVFSNGGEATLGIR